MSLNKQQINEYRALKDSGVNLDSANKIKPNAGSETVKHLVSKALVARAGVVNGYRVDSEVQIQTPAGKGYADVVLWGHKSRMSYCVEIETSPEEDTLQEKKELYVDPTQIDDILLLNTSSIPMDMVEAYQYVAECLGLEP